MKGTIASCRRNAGKHTLRDSLAETLGMAKRDLNIYFFSFFYDKKLDYRDYNVILRLGLMGPRKELD